MVSGKLQRGFTAGFHVPLIVDLSAPHNDKNHVSLNQLINKDDYSLTYVKLDDAIRGILQRGQGSWLCKTDIVDAFKQIPVHPSLWHLYGVKWKGEYFFYTRLVFGSRSSPKIFDWIPQAVCWIAKHNYGIEFILHLLDDFLTIDRPNAAADRTMALITMIFNRLRIPISPSKTVGPTVQLQYLGIILDTDRMQARLPLDKVIRIREMLFKFGQKQSVSEWQGKRIMFYCDNLATVFIINKGRSRAQPIMKLMRRLTWCAAKGNFVIIAKHIPGIHNDIADALSRFQISRFRELAPGAALRPCPCPTPAQVMWY